MRAKCRLRVNPYRLRAIAISKRRIARFAHACLRSPSAIRNRPPDLRPLRPAGGLQVTQGGEGRYQPLSRPGYSCIGYTMMPFLDSHPRPIARRLQALITPPIGRNGHFAFYRNSESPRPSPSSFRVRRRIPAIRSARFLLSAAARPLI